MTKQVTREQLNQLLEQEVDRYIQEELIYEGKMVDFLKKHMGELVNVAEKVLEKGISSIVGISAIYGIILSVFATTGYKLAKNIQFSEDTIKEMTKESNQRIKDLLMENSESLQELLTQSKDLAFELITHPSGFGMAIVIAVVAALSFLLRIKIEDRRQAKKKVNKALKKNDKLDKNLQKYCNRLADKVYT